MRCFLIQVNAPQVHRYPRLKPGFLGFAALRTITHYTELHRHLRSHYRPVFENKRLVVLDLHTQESGTMIDERVRGERYRYRLSEANHRQTCHILIPPDIAVAIATNNNGFGSM